MLILSCSESYLINEDISHDKYSTQEIDKWEVALIEFGTPENLIERLHDGFLIDGDLFLSFDNCEVKYLEWSSLFKGETGEKLRASECGYLRNALGYVGNRHVIPVTIEDDVPDAWRDGAIMAMNDWNNLPTNALYFYLNDDTSCRGGTTIRLKNYSDNEDNFAKVSWIPGIFIDFTVAGSIYINSGRDGWDRPGVHFARNVIAHELGHTIGFMHPGPFLANLFASCNIRGTDDDRQSLMNQERNRNNANSPFLGDDIRGITTMFPRMFLTQGTDYHGCDTYFDCTKCPPGFWFDGENCYSGIHYPDGWSPFVWEDNGFYLVSQNGTCPPGYWFNGAHCYHHSAKHFPNSYDPLVWNNTFYVKPNCDF